MDHEYQKKLKICQTVNLHEIDISLAGMHKLFMQLLLSSVFYIKLQALPDAPAIHVGLGTEIIVTIEHCRLSAKASIIRSRCQQNQWQSWNTVLTGTADIKLNNQGHVDKKDCDDIQESLANAKVSRTTALACIIGYN